MYYVSVVSFDILEENIYFSKRKQTCLIDALFLHIKLISEVDYELATQILSQIS